MFPNFLMTMYPLNKGMILRQNTTCMKIFIFSGYNSTIDSKIIVKVNYENATNLIIHDYHLVKGSRVITSDKVTSTEICSILISRAQNKPSSNIYNENLYMTIILTGQQSICYHA